MKLMYFFLLLLCTSTGMIASSRINHQMETIQYSLETSFQEKNTLKVSYTNGQLIVIGQKNKATIEIYNLLGKQVVNLTNVTINGSFSKYISLAKNNIYIVKISTKALTKAFKIVAK